MNWSSKIAPLIAPRSTCSLLAVSLLMIWPAAQAGRAASSASFYGVAVSGVHVAAWQAGGAQYLVEPGDTFYSIARRFGITVAALQAANPGVEASALQVGQRLAIPGFEGIDGVLATRPVSPGETLDSLALKLGLRRETLVRLNRIVNPRQLYIGEEIIVTDWADGGATLPAATAYVLGEGESLFALAAAHNQSPWALAAINRLPHPAALAPGALVFVPGGDRSISALPFPLQALEVRPVPVEQGRTLVVRVESAEPVTLTGVLGDRAAHFNRDTDGALVALLGIYRFAEPNLYQLFLSAVRADGTACDFAQALPVRAGNFATEPPLKVDPVTLEPTVTGPENELLSRLTAPVTPRRLWDGLFTLPSVGALRSVYGSLRSYNFGPYIYFHTGVDFSGGDDRPITAPASGIVVFAGPLVVRGNAVVIDHGWGVYTGYWHQSRILVAVGEQVETGQIIGYNGSTGRVTGPHLHWELWVGGVQVDPLEWTERSFP